MVKCFKSGRTSDLFRDKHRPMWQSASGYCFGIALILVAAMWILRDTTPIHFVAPSIEDMNRPRGEMATRQELDNVYWRVTIRTTSAKLKEICKEESYHLITHKNIRQDGNYMSQSYIFLCNPIDGIPFFPYFVIHDLVPIVVFLFVFCAILKWNEHTRFR